MALTDGWYYVQGVRRNHRCKAGFQIKSFFFQVFAHFEMAGQYSLQNRIPSLQQCINHDQHIPDSSTASGLLRQLTSPYTWPLAADKYRGHAERTGTSIAAKRHKSLAVPAGPLTKRGLQKSNTGQAG